MNYTLPDTIKVIESGEILCRENLTQKLSKVTNKNVKEVKISNVTATYLSVKDDFETLVENVCHHLNPDQVIVSLEKNPGLQDMDRFECFSKNWPNFTCQIYPSKNTHLYQLMYKPDSNDNNLMDCQLTSNQKAFSCFIDEKTYKTPKDSFIFELIYNQAFQMFYNFSNVGNIKLDPPQSINKSSVKKPTRKITVCWQVSSFDKFPHSIKYEVGYTTKYNRDWTVAITSDALKYNRNYCSEFNYTCAGTDHCIRVRYRVVHSQSYIESDWSNFTTYNPPNSNDCAYNNIEDTKC